ncbi:MAG: NRAMP family divalent metal transporter [Haloferacaceae archaeon]
MSETGEPGLRDLLARTGPTWLAGAIAAGPATMASLLTAGATFGYDLLWVVVLSATLGAIAQYLASRLGLLSGEGIVTTVERVLGEGWAWLLVIDVVLASGLAQLVIMRTVADVSSTVTGVDARIWAVAWALVLAVGLAGGGYRVAEIGAKLLVSAVVIAFVASLAVVPIDGGGAAAGLVPRIPAGIEGALLAAGILGGAVHITLITMQTYTVRARGWTTDDIRLAKLDVGVSMIVAFGGYSLAIFLVTAAVLHSPEVTASELSPTSAAQALGPLVGENAQRLFLLGLWGAAVSTLGGNTVVPPYLVADKLGWGTDVSDPRYRALIVVVALLSAGGAFLGGALFPLLALVLAFGLVGTPFAVALVLVLLDSEAVPGRTSTAANLGGLAVFAVGVATAGRFVLSRAGTATTDPISAVVVAFAAVFGIATLALGVRFLRDRYAVAGATGS